MKRFIFVKLMICFLGLTNSVSAFDMNALPKELMRLILSYCYDRSADEKIAVVNTFKKVTMLKSTCKTFAKALNYKTVDTMFAKFNNIITSKLLHDIIFINETTGTIGSIAALHYASKSFFAISLMCAGAELSEKAHNKLVSSAFYYNDINLISLLCNKKKINLNKLNWNKTPLFFYAQTIEMAQLCEKNNVNIHSTTSKDCYYTNILWVAVSRPDISSDLLDFYLKKNVSILSRSFDGKSLLHELAVVSGYAITNMTDFLNKAQLLLTKKPALINSLSRSKITALNATMDALASLSFFQSTECTEAYIKLLKEHGGKASEELLSSKSNQIAPTDQSECVLW